MINVIIGAIYGTSLFAFICSWFNKPEALILTAIGLLYLIVGILLEIYQKMEKTQ